MRSEQWFDRRKFSLVFATRFIPGTRAAAYFALGAVRAHFGWFALYFSVAAAIWVSLIVTLTMFFGQSLFGFLSVYHDYVLLTAVSSILLLYVVWKILVPLCSFRSRRLLISRWRRLTGWEYWPWWVMHLPTAAYLVWLGLQFRYMAFFTIVNPAIPTSGAIGERKSMILSALEKAGAPVARWKLISRKDPLKEQWIQVKAFREQYGLDYPLVFKPDEGQRGLGVAIIRSKEAGLSYLKQAAVNTLVQEYISGREYGIFYYRYPNASKGDIFSITDKRMVSVVGDGKSTLERLILKNLQTTALAPLFLKRFIEDLEQVPKEGERVALTELGTHALGALFLDANHLKTSELLKAVEGFSKRYRGFYFGRYDIRVPSVEDLKAGKNMTVLELNGLTSEPTHIYDPRHNYFYACRTIWRQCRIIFEIARQNVAYGLKPMSSRRFFGQLLVTLRRQRRIKSLSE